MLRVSGLTPDTKYKLHFKLLKLDAHSSELQVSNKGYVITIWNSYLIARFIYLWYYSEAIADANGTATWKLRSYLVCDVEMHVEGSACTYAPFTCRFTSRKKGGEKTKASALDMHVTGMYYMHALASLFFS